MKAALQNKLKADTDEIRKEIGSFFYIQKGSHNLVIHNLEPFSSWVNVQNAMDSIKLQK